jgi:hypothetical protein
MYLTEELQKKWQPVLDIQNSKLLPILTRSLLQLVLENQEQVIGQDRQLRTKQLSTPVQTNVTGSAVQNFDPILISSVRRSFA